MGDSGGYSAAPAATTAPGGGVGGFSKGHMPPISGSSSIEEVSSTSTLVIGGTSHQSGQGPDHQKTLLSFQNEVNSYTAAAGPTNNSGGGLQNIYNSSIPHAGHPQQQQHQQQTSLSNITGALSKRFTVRDFVIIVGVKPLK